MTTTAQRTVNGLDTKQLVGTVEAIKAQPALARFQFRNRNRWVSGGENHSTIRESYGAGREDDSRRPPSKQHSPVCNTVCRPVPVVIERVLRSRG